MGSRAGLQQLHRDSVHCPSSLDWFQMNNFLELSQWVLSLRKSVKLRVQELGQFHSFQHSHDLPFLRFSVQLLLRDFLFCFGVCGTQGLMHPMNMLYHQAISQESGLIT